MNKKQSRFEICWNVIKNFKSPTHENFNWKKMKKIDFFPNPQRQIVFICPKNLNSCAWPPTNPQWCTFCSQGIWEIFAIFFEFLVLKKRQTDNLMRFQNFKNTRRMTIFVSFFFFISKIFCLIFRQNYFIKIVPLFFSQGIWQICAETVNKNCFFLCKILIPN